MKVFTSKFFAIFVLGANLIISPLTATAQTNIHDLKSGFWEGAVKANSSGEASYCYLLAKKNDDTFTIQLYWDDEGFHVLIYSPKWSFVEGQQFQGRVKIDKKFDESIDGSVFDTESLDYFFGYNQPAIKAFQAGSRISLEGPGGTKSFRLIGTRAAVNVLMNCAEEYLVPSLASDTSKPDYKIGLAAYQTGDFAGALAQWLPLAEQGDARTQTYVGEMYRDGEGVPVDDFEAARWFRLAADQGSARAQNNLGVRYYVGGGVELDFAEAVYWFRVAAEQGNAMAQNNLAEMYRDGEGVFTSREHAIFWFRAAAEQGHDRAQTSLDEMLASGDVTPDTLPDEPPVNQPSVGPVQSTYLPGDVIEVSYSGLPAVGQDWLAISAQSHSNEQYFELVMLADRPTEGTHIFGALPIGDYEVRLYTNWPEGGYDIVTSSKIVVAPTPEPPQPAVPVEPVQPEPRPTPPEPRPVQPMPLPKESKAQEVIDYSNSLLSEIAKLAEADPDAMVAFALVLLEGELVPYDPITAAELINNAADTGNRRATLMLSLMLEKGLGMTSDPVRAASLLNEAADTGLPDALFHRARKALESDPDAASRELAMQDLLLAGAQGHIPALQVIETLENWQQE